MKRQIFSTRIEFFQIIAEVIASSIGAEFYHCGKKVYFLGTKRQFNFVKSIIFNLI